jgi:hypothetical protein
MYSWSLLGAVSTFVVVVFVDDEIDTAAGDNFVFVRKSDRKLVAALEVVVVVVVATLPVDKDSSCCCCCS